MGLGRIALTASLLAGCVAPLVPAATASAAASPGAPSAPSSGRTPRSLCAPPADTVGPTASKVSFGRASIDLDSGSRVQTVTVDVADTSGDGAPSGVAGVGIFIRGNGFGASPKLKLASGTAASGEWTGTFEVSKYAHPGTYSINDLEVTDAAGNTQDYAGYSKTPDSPNALSLHPADDPTFAVTGTPATHPRDKPGATLSAFTLTPTQVDTTSTSRVVHVVARFSGGVAPSKVAANFDSTPQSRHVHEVFLHGVLTFHDGRWRGAIRVPRWLGEQKLGASLFAVYGSVSRVRYRSYDTDTLALKHFPSTVAVHSGVDRTPPNLTHVSISPHPIDSTTGPEKVTVTARVTDTGSGVRSVEIGSGIRNGLNGTASGSYPFAGAGIGYTSSQNFNVRLKKNAQGLWVGSTIVRQCVPSGTYKLTAQLSDVAGNEKFYSTKQLAAAHLTSTVKVTSKHGDVEAPYVYSAATYGADRELFLNFSEGVANVSTSTLTVFALTPESTRYQSPTTIASIVCSNGTDTIPCSGTSGLVTSAVLTVPDMTAGDKYTVYANLDQVVPQLTDGNRNPLDWNYAAAEVLDS